MGGNFAEVKGLVIRNRIEYSFEKYLGNEGARKMESLQTIFYISDRGALKNPPILRGREPFN